METEVKTRELKIHCPAHQTTFHINETSKIFCDTVDHSLSDNFPYDKFWEYCCDCQTFTPTDLETSNSVQETCQHCERTTISRFICGNCKIVTKDSGEETKGKIFSVNFDSKTIEPSCPGCLKSFTSADLSLHKCDSSKAVFLTSRESCPFCKKEIVSSNKEKQIKCPKCKSLNAADAAFCVDCRHQLRSDISDIKVGTQIPKTQLLNSICPNCGKQNEPDSIFCPDCGQGLKTSPATPTPPIIPPVELIPDQPPTLVLPINPNPSPFKTGMSTNTKGCLAVIGILFGLILMCAVFQGIKNQKSSPPYSSGNSNTTNSNTTLSNSYTTTTNSYSNSATSNSTGSTELTYSGKIGKKSMDFTMKLTRNGNRLTGTASTPLGYDGVYGEIDDDGAFTLRAYENDDMENQTGFYRGTLKSDGSISGRWTNMQGDKPNSFSVNQVF